MVMAIGSMSFARATGKSRRHREPVVDMKTTPGWATPVPDEAQRRRWKSKGRAGWFRLLGGSRNWRGEVELSGEA
jgi:hypothetical protein